jgi:acetyltransferase
MNLKRILDAKSVAVIGASQDVTKRGYQAVQALLTEKYDGKLYLVNPRGESMFGLPCYPGVRDIEEPVDLALITTPARTIPSIIEDCGAKNIAGAVIIAAGYGELGEAGQKLQHELVAIANTCNVRIIGPNTNGIINFKSNMNLVGVHGIPRGEYALLTQSGNMALQLMNEAKDTGLGGFTYYVGVGNQADIKFHEYLEFFADDPDTRAIVIYMEGLKDGRKFIQAAHQTVAKKPIILLKGGRSETGQKSAGSHTGALAGLAEVNACAFSSAGIITIENPDELFPVAATLAKLPAIRDQNIAILADGGGHATIAADLLTDHGVNLFQLCEQTQTKLKNILPHTASLANPVDVGGGTDSDPAVLAECARMILEDDRVGGLLIVGMFGGYGIRFAEKLKELEAETAHRFGQIIQTAAKPIVFHSLYDRAKPRALEILKDYRIPVYGSLSIACKCIAALSQYGNHLNQPFAANRFEIHPGQDAKPEGQALLHTALKEGRTSLLESEAKDLLRLHDVPVTPDRLVRDENEAVEFWNVLGREVVLKIVSPDILHKSDAGCVRLNLKDEKEVREAFGEILENARAWEPDADLRGCLIGPMMAAGTELIIGTKRDAQFGPFIMFGLGGILVEVLKDVAFRTIPLAESDAMQMMSEVKSSKILNGLRGQAAVNKQAICDLLLKVSQLVQSYPQIQEMDLNPVIAYDDRVVAVDARILLNQNP